VQEFTGSLHQAALLAAEASVLPIFDQIQAVEQAAKPDRYVDTSPLISPRRVYTKYLACRGKEPCNVLAPRGYDAARAADGLHLCPTQTATVNGVVGPTCTVYSTAEQRFADQVAAG
jgi:hypothetical protein